MTPAAHTQAAIEVLEDLLPALKESQGKPADALLAEYFRMRRYIGGKDKQAIAALFYGVLRHLGELTWRLQLGGTRVTARMLMALYITGLKQEIFTGERYAPDIISPREKEDLRAAKEVTALPPYAVLNVPEFLYAKLHEEYGDRLEPILRALNKEAPVDIRVNTLKTTRDAALQSFSELGFDPVPCPYSPVGIRLKKRGALFATELFKKGAFEMQDEASQITALLVDARPSMRVIDFCAGAGGKTLAIAAAMKNKGRILAWDVAEHRMKDLRARLTRAGADTVQIHSIENEADPFIKRHHNTADRVLVDAPCSGSGTWRRNPDLKWKMTPESLARVMQTQENILRAAAKLVKPGGRLIYATCSLLKEENNQQVEKFLEQHTQFSVAPAREIWDKDHPCPSGLGDYLHLNPHQDGTDGFFAAVLVRSAGK